MDSFLTNDQEKGSTIPQIKKTAPKGWTPTNIQNGSEEAVPNFPRLFQNGMLISKILSYLTPQDLLGCRLLCKVWNSEASKILGKRITLTLDFRYPYYLPSPPVFQGMSQVGKKLAILLPEFAERRTSTSPQLDEGWKPWPRKSIHPKMLIQLSEFLSFPNHFSSLTLNLTTTNSSPTDVSILTLILEKFSQTLKTLLLQFHVHFGDSEPESFEGFRRTLTFTLPSLTTFSHFSSRCDDCEGSSAWMRDRSLNWASFFTPLFPEKVEKFSFNRNNFRMYCKHFLKTGKTPEISELYLKEVLDLHFREFLEIEFPLKSLEISSLLVLTEGENFVQKILQKLAPSLERLVISFTCLAVLVEINVPVFPKLREFSLAYESRTDKLVWGLDGVIEYCQMFPVLSSLEIIPLDSYSRHRDANNYQPVFDSFFPENSSQVCETVTELKIPGLNAIEGYNPDYTLYRDKERLRTIDKMFPNACNAGWKEWRDFNS